MVGGLRAFQGWYFTQDAATFLIRPMNITDLQITNFRCFADARLRIAPITLVTGANSAGKSSLFAPLLAAAQTDGMPAMLSPNGRHIDMGDYRAMVHRHRSESVLRVTLKGESQPGEPTTIASAFSYDKASPAPRLLSLSYTGSYYRLSVSHDDDSYHLSYDVTPSKSPSFKSMRDDSAVSELLDAISTLLTSRASDAVADIPQPSLLRDIKNGEPIRGSASFVDPRDFFGALNRTDIRISFFVASELSQAIRSFQSRFGHVSSFRLAPKRTYYDVSRADLRVGRYGENYVEQLSQWESTGSPKIDQLRTDLADLGILSALRIRRLGGGRLELVGQPKDRSSVTNLADLGFGTSQVLPVLVAVNQLPDGSMFTVSQPETHLHPEVQARLADYFVRLARQRRFRFIVETHSEYLINRLRILVAEGSVPEEDVSVVYVMNDGETATVCPIDLRTDGQMAGAPDEFFDTYMTDVMKLALGGED